MIRVRSVKWNRVWYFCLLTFAFCLLTFGAPQHRMMPVPSSVAWQNGRLALPSTLNVAVTGLDDPRLKAAVDRAVKRLEARTGFKAASTGSAFLRVECQASGNPLPKLGEDESYSLEVTGSGAVLRAPAVIGVIRGLETFLQLVEKDAAGVFVPAVRITDRPRFPWRGLLIDVCRHWQPIEVVKRNLDAMAAYKLNVFHFHLSEDQGFRVESKKLPRLHRMGSDGLYYTQAQIREVVAYAAERGIRVIPEFDIPGHITSWLVGYPKMGSGPAEYSIIRKFGIFDGALDPTREEVYEFLDTFLGEMATLFPDAYMHIGGDEVTGKHWQKNPRIQAFMKEKQMKDWHALQAYFNQRVSKILEKHGKRMVGWDEILHPDLPTTIVVQSWRGSEYLAESARKGYTGILSHGYYLDQIHSAGRHYQVDPLPANTTLDATQAARILGGEACQWGEHVGPSTIDSRIWPRLTAIAERLWSPREVNDVADMYRRMDAQDAGLRELGIGPVHDRLFERLAGRRALAPMRALTDVIEPVSFGLRNRIRPLTQQTPLTSLIDMSKPDSRVAREFAARVETYLNDPAQREAVRGELRQSLTAWSRLHATLSKVAAPTPLVREALPVARELAALSAAGLKALDQPASEWRTAQKKLLDKAADRRPSAVAFTTLLPALRKLIETPEK